MSRPRILIAGAGFAGYRTAHTLPRLPRQKADITLLNPTDHFLFPPLLLQVAAGVLEPRRVTASLPGALSQVRLVLGEADGIDLGARTVRYTDPEGESGTLGYDRLVLAVGSVNELYPRDHVTQQVEPAAAADGPKSCAARWTRRRRSRRGCRARGGSRGGARSSRRNGFRSSRRNGLRNSPPHRKAES